MNTKTDATRFRTGGALSFVAVWQHLQPYEGHRESWNTGAWMCGGPLDAPWFLPRGSTADQFADSSATPPIPPRPVSTGHYRADYFD